MLSNLFAEAVNKTAKPEKAKADTKAPEPTSITKIFGDKKTTEYKPGNHGRLAGTKLLFDEADPETGVFLQSASGEPVRVNDYGKICDTSIVIAIPEGFPAGKTDIEVRTRSVDGKMMRGNLVDSIMVAD